MPKVSDEHRAARRDQILDAAQRVLAAKGYRGTSMADIIQESGLSAGALYGYFAGKAELFQAVAERVTVVYGPEVLARESDEPRSPGEFMRAIVHTMTGQPILEMAPQVWAEATVDPEIRGVMGTVLTRLGDVIRAEMTAWADQHPEAVVGDHAAWATAVTPVMIAAITGFILQRILVPGFDEDAYLDARPIA
jgi:AcrR family transcriptional regulator